MGHYIMRAVVALSILLFVSEGFAMRSMAFLEKFDLSDLSYIRMQSYECKSQQIISATILDAEELPHTVRVGDYIGKHYGVIEEITPDHIVVAELYPSNTGGWLRRTVIVPKVEDKSPRTRFRYEEDHALQLLGEADAAGSQLRERLIQCRQLYGKDAERLACFDEAVGLLF